jgi:hypothetical protein
VPSPAAGSGPSPRAPFVETDDDEDEPHAADEEAEAEAGDDDEQGAGDAKSRYDWRHHELPSMAGDARAWRPNVSAASPPMCGPWGVKTRLGLPTPGACFMMFVPKVLLAGIAATSTSYSHATRTTPQVYGWEDVLAFVLVLITMGHIVLPRLRWYWHGTMAQERVVEIMPSYHFFCKMTQDLHLFNTADFNPEEQAVKNKQNAFWKLGTLVEDLNLLFTALRIALRDLTLDEFTIAFKGRHRARCFNKDKPEKYHLKGFSLNEAGTGYCISFYMYQGKDEQRPVGVSATTFPVTVLIGRNKSLHHKGYILWADNWFSSVHTVLACMDVGVDYVGTVRADRVDRCFGKPSKPKDWTVADRGKCRSATTTSLTRPLWVIQWQDRKVVTMITTIEGFMSHTQRKDKSSSRGFERKIIAIPTIISAYNFGKVGTDRMDQQVACYYRNTRLRWHIKVFVHLMFICMHNAHVTYMDLHGIVVDDLPLLTFIRTVVDELKPPPRKASKRRRPKRGGCHTPSTMGPKVKAAGRPSGQPSTYQAIPEGERQRWHCVVCNSYTSTWCKECDAVLHLNTTNSKKTCWSDFHATEGSDSD